MIRSPRASKALSFILLATGVALSTGCTMCCPPYLEDYATVGGKWSRANPTDGRVGSAFSDTGIVSTAGGETVIIDDGHSHNQVLPAIPMGEEIQVIESSEIGSDTIILGESW